MSITLVSQISSPPKKKFIQHTYPPDTFLLDNSNQPTLPGQGLPYPSTDGIQSAKNASYDTIRYVLVLGARGHMIHGPLNHTLHIRGAV